MNIHLKILFLFLFLTLTFHSELKAQPPLTLFFAPPNPMASWQPPASLQKNNTPLFLLQNSPPSPYSIPGLNPSPYTPYRIQTEKWPLFCRLEWQWEKKTSLPWKLRLGSTEYVDWLEGKW